MRGLRAAAVLSLSLVAAAPAPAQVADWPTERPPRPLPARDVKFPPYSLKTLGNGLQVTSMGSAALPVMFAFGILGRRIAQADTQQPEVREPARA